MVDVKTRHLMRGGDFWHYLHNPYLLIKPAISMSSLSQKSFTNIHMSSLELAEHSPKMSSSIMICGT